MHQVSGTTIQGPMISEASFPVSNDELGYEPVQGLHQSLPASNAANGSYLRHDRERPGKARRRYSEPAVQSSTPPSSRVRRRRQPQQTSNESFGKPVFEKSLSSSNMEEALLEEDESSHVRWATDTIPNNNTSTSASSMSTASMNDDRQMLLGFTEDMDGFGEVVKSPITTSSHSTCSKMGSRRRSRNVEPSQRLSNSDFLPVDPMFGDFAPQGSPSFKADFHTSLPASAFGNPLGDFDNGSEDEDLQVVRPINPRLWDSMPQILTDGPTKLEFDDPLTPHREKQTNNEDNDHSSRINRLLYEASSNAKSNRKMKTDPKESKEQKVLSAFHESFSSFLEEEEPECSPQSKSNKISPLDYDANHSPTTSVTGATLATTATDASHSPIPSTIASRENRRLSATRRKFKSDPAKPNRDQLKELKAKLKKKQAEIQSQMEEEETSDMFLIEMEKMRAKSAFKLESKEQAKLKKEKSRDRKKSKRRSLGGDPTVEFDVEDQSDNFESSWDDDEDYDIYDDHDDEATGIFENLSNSQPLEIQWHPPDFAKEEPTATQAGGLRMTRRYSMPASLQDYEPVTPSFAYDKSKKKASVLGDEQGGIAPPPFLPTNYDSMASKQTASAVDSILKLEAGDMGDFSAVDLGHEQTLEDAREMKQHQKKTNLHTSNNRGTKTRRPSGQQSIGQHSDMGIGDFSGIDLGYGEQVAKETSETKKSQRRLSRGKKARRPSGQHSLGHHSDGDIGNSIGVDLGYEEHVVGEASEMKKSQRRMSRGKTARRTSGQHSFGQNSDGDVGDLSGVDLGYEQVFEEANETKQSHRRMNPSSSNRVKKTRRPSGQLSKGHHFEARSSTKKGPSARLDGCSKSTAEGRHRKSHRSGKTKRRGSTSALEMKSSDHGNADRSRRRESMPVANREGDKRGTRTASKSRKSSKTGRRTSSHELNSSGSSRRENMTKSRKSPSRRRVKSADRGSRRSKSPKSSKQQLSKNSISGGKESRRTRTKSSSKKSSHTRRSTMPAGVSPAAGEPIATEKRKTKRTSRRKTGPSSLSQSQPILTNTTSLKNSSVKRSKSLDRSMKKSSKKRSKSPKVKTKRRSSLNSLEAHIVVPREGLPISSQNSTSGHTFTTARSEEPRANRYKPSLPRRSDSWSSDFDLP